MVLIYLVIKHLLNTSSVLFQPLGSRDWGGGSIVEVTCSQVCIGHMEMEQVQDTWKHSSRTFYSGPERLTRYSFPPSHNTVVTIFQRP